MRPGTREDVGDLWTYPCDARVITTNGVVKANRELVMGAGVAKAAATRYPRLAKYLGESVAAFGNTPVVYHALTTVVSFPTKHDWREPSDPKLIEQSAHTLARITNAYGWKDVAMTRPGCGLGGLQWADVKKIIEPILDSRFVVLTPS